MGTILIASGNRHKHREIARILAAAGIDAGEIVPPGELVIATPPPDPIENGGDYLENARIKARAYSHWSGLPALADDSGLEVLSLGNAPGLRSARYAGESADFDASIKKLLSELEGEPPESRSAVFFCALVLCHGDEVLFSTVASCPGTILEAPSGDEGFGYDPIFVPTHTTPTQTTRSFAQMTESEKDAISHRGRALRAFAAHRFASRSTSKRSPSGSGGPSPR